MANMTVKNNAFELPISIAAKSAAVTKELKTADTYIDKNIKITVTDTTPDAELEVKSAGTVTATASTNDTTYTSSTVTPYPITISADASVDASTVGVKTAGYVATTDEISVPGSSATKNNKTVYVKQGVLAASGQATAVGGNGLELGAAVSTAPTSGFYVKASAAGGASVTTAGWLPVGATAEGAGDAYYPIATATLANTGTGDFVEVTAPVLVSGGYLYINEGYIENTKISLANLVPDIATVTTADSKYIYNTVSVYDKDGALIAGTMGDAALGNISASDAAATITSVSVAASGDAFKVTGSKAISGSTSVQVSTEGYAPTTLKKTGSISGTANVSADLAKIDLGVTASSTNVKVTPVISKNSGTNVLSSAITKTAPGTGVHYVAVNTSAIAASADVTPKVNTAGYGTTTVYGSTGATVTAGANASGTYYIPLTEGSHSVTKSASSITAPVSTVTTTLTGGDVTPVTVAASGKVTGQKYVEIAASSTTTSGSVTTNAVCTSTEGYITASTEDVVTTETVSVANANATKKYIKVYNGEVV